MYTAADEIRKRLMGRSRREIRLEAIRTQGGATEEEVDRLLDCEKRILPHIFQQYKVRITEVLKYLQVKLSRNLNANYGQIRRIRGL